MTSSLDSRARMPIPEGFAFHNAAGDEDDRKYFGTVTDPSGLPVAFIRENINASFAEGLQELKFLELAGVKVAQHIPFIGPNNRECLLVEYVHGEVLEEGIAERVPDACVELAHKVAVYSAAAILDRRAVLADITSNFQYILREDNEPVLVDLDMHLYTGQSLPEHQRALARGIYEELCEQYGMLPRDRIDDAQQILRPLLEIDRI